MKQVVAGWIAAFMVCGSVLVAAYLDINTDINSPLVFFFLGGTSWAVAGFLAGRYGD